MPFLLLLTISVLGGVAAGWLANWAADELPRRSPRPAAQAEMAADFKPAPWRAKAVTAALAILFPLLAWRLGAELGPLLVNWCYAWFLVTVLVIDLETRRVLNIMTAPAALFAVAAGHWLGTPGLASILTGGLAGLLLFWGLYLIGVLLFRRAALGLGDVKLAGVIGLMTGYPAVLQALVIGILLGGAGALVLLITRRAGRKSSIAYAPYLAIGAMLALWAGIGGT